MKNINKFELDYLTNNLYKWEKKAIQSFNFALDWLKEIIDIENFLKLLFKKINLAYKTTNHFYWYKINNPKQFISQDSSISDSLCLSNEEFSKGDNLLREISLFEYNKEELNYFLKLELKWFWFREEEKDCIEIFKTDKEFQIFYLNKNNLLNFKHLITILFNFMNEKEELIKLSL